MSASTQIAKMKKLGHILSRKTYRRALKQGAAAGVEHERIICELPCETVVDIGANRGQFALAARYCFPTAVIFSFEPLPAPMQSFRRVFADDKNVRLFPIAIGTQSGNATIHVSTRDDSSSLLPITATQNRLFPGTAEAETQTIQVGHLIDFLSADELAAPSLLKLDVQGFELEALRGCEDLLHCFAWVYVECSFVELYQGQALADEVISWLRERGFVLSGVYNMAYDSHGKAVQADFLFTRQISKP